MSSFDYAKSVYSSIGVDVEKAMSRLEEIPGIGTERRRALLKHFGSAKAVAKASEEELASVRGMTRPAARAVYAHFHPAGEEENR